MFCVGEPVHVHSEEVVCKEGNFSLITSQQPAPLIGFGDNILSKGQVEVWVYGDNYLGKHAEYIDIVPSVLYGITNDLSLLLSVPVAAKYQENAHSSSGFEDLSFQMEYAIYNLQYPCSNAQWTVVAAASVPTGSIHKNPPTGFGNMTYFLGTTYNHTWKEWFLFTEYGVQIPLPQHGTKVGNQYLYQLGFGKTVFQRGGWIFSWMTEIDGSFFERNKVKGHTNPDSGGNVIYVTPSLWASSNQWIFQLGVGYAVQQRFFGHQNPDRYLFAFTVERLF